MYKYHIDAAQKEDVRRCFELYKSFRISQYQKYHNTLCLFLHIFLMHNFGGTNKEYYGIFKTG